MRTTLALLALTLLAAGCGARNRAVAAPPPPPKPTLFAPISVSSNWGGYVVTRRNGGGFRRASGTWTMPRIRCVAGQGSSAAFWVGIGGFGATSPSLQQLGASADCSPQGATSYRLWTEIVPARPRFVPLAVRPGDRITATVTTQGRSVTFALDNLTTRKRFSGGGSIHGATDVSTAEWIAEAPSICRTITTCQVVPLSNFSSVRFDAVSAGAATHTGRLVDPNWSLLRVALVSSAGSPSFVAASNPAGAIPGGIAPPGRSFSVAYRGHVFRSTPPHPLPGAPLPDWMH